ncbi:MAG: cytochrome oxidase subunit I, partial [Weeksellaceae bacterium]|nr:cytochrome oxidase subunit I [Weeksellaceae bacterium]
MKRTLIQTILLLVPFAGFAQFKNISADNWASSPGVIGTLILILIVALIAVVIMSAKISSYAESLKERQLLKRNKAFDDEIINLEEGEIDSILEKRKAALKYQISGKELSGDMEASDDKGLIYKSINHPENEILFADKVSHETKINVSPEMKKLVSSYVGASV